MLRRIVPFFNGIVFTIAFIAAAGYVGVRQGLLPAGADVKPSRVERWAARTSLDATLDRDTKHLSNPLQPTDANLTSGIKVYAANCAVCHGAADAKPSKLAQGFYIKAPQLAQDGVEDDDESETFWKVEHGIRFTAMPAFAATLTTDDAWNVAMFLKRMNALPPAVAPAWRAVPSAQTP